MPRGPKRKRSTQESVLPRRSQRRRLVPEHATIFDGSPAQGNDPAPVIASPRARSQPIVEEPITRTLVSLTETISSLQETVKGLSESQASLTTQVQAMQAHTLLNPRVVGDMALPVPPVRLQALQGVDYGNSNVGNVSNSGLPVGQSNVHVTTSELPHLPLRAFVSDKVKSKIWSNQYVDLGVLLQDNESSESFDLSVDESGSSIQLVPHSKPKLIKNINTWLTAFHTFTDVYVVRFPAEVGNLMKYMELVRSLAVRGGNWSRYDQQFRRAREFYPYPWEAMHSELWMQALSSSITQPQTNKSFGRNERPFRSSVTYPSGYCFRFQDTGKCTLHNCKFFHKCFKCQGKHGAKQCGRMRQPTSEANSPPAPPSGNSTTHFSANTNKNK